LEGIIEKSRSSFGSEQSFQRARRHLLSCLVSFGRHTISGLLRAQNRHQQDWSADYRFYSRDRFNEQEVFAHLRQELEATLEPQAPLVTAMDDSLLRKTGRKIHGVRYQRDPLSPPFNVNFVRGLRVLQISAAIPQGEGAARMVPVDFEHAVLPPKPPRRASEEELQIYKKLRAERNINKVGQQRIEQLRQQMDQSGSVERRLIVSVDGRFTNGTVFKTVPQRTVLIGRLRKDAVLYYLPEQQPARGRKRKYGALAPTPEQLLKDESVPWETAEAFACGRRHEFKIKRLKLVVARMDKAARPMQILVIKPLGYRLTQGGKLFYRQPAFLVCTDPQLPVEQLLQFFLWRWDIEVNFRDEKTILGVGQAQVRTPASNQSAPALAVAAYAMLLLASIRTYGKAGTPDRLHQPKWYKRKTQQRATTSELINQLRFELWAGCLNTKHFRDFSSATNPKQKSEKNEMSLAAVLFTSIK
jgi:DDE superfamily endonuclease